MKKRTQTITILVAVLVLASVISVAAISAVATDKAAVEEKIDSIEDVCLMKTDKVALSFVRTRSSYERPLSSGSIKISLTGITKERSERNYDVYEGAEGTEYVFISGTNIVCSMTFTYHPSDKNSNLTTMEYIGEEAADEVAKAYMASGINNFGLRPKIDTGCIMVVWVQ
ncbi:MAG: hypothetical protein MJ137_04465, partial [Clostridia bacterium]|nr:hypothetical protein [Clostridia bacterium]